MGLTRFGNLDSMAIVHIEREEGIKEKKRMRISCCTYHWATLSAWEGTQCVI